MEELIRPSSDLRNKYNEMSKLCRESKKPISITVNGRGDTALINLTVYRQQMAELELLKALAEAENDVTTENIGLMSESFEQIRKDLLSRKK